MNLTEKYLQEIVPSLKTIQSGGDLKIGSKNGSPTYYFCCPFCSHKASKPSTRRKRTAALFPAHGSTYEYIFHCRRSCVPNMAFSNFLHHFKPHLGKKFVYELNTNDETFYKQNFSENIFPRK